MCLRFTYSGKSYSVTSVGLSAFCVALDDGTRAGVSGLVSVRLPNVSSVGTQSFMFCPDLTTVDLPAAVAVSDSAFSGCSSLSSVSLPSLSFVGAFAFGWCAALFSVSLPGALTLGEAAFRGCASLSSLSLPAVTSLAPDTFADCSSLSSFVLGPDVSSVGTFAFGDCSQLSSLFCPSELSLPADAVPSSTVTLTYTVDETQDVPGKTKVTLVSSTNAAPTSVSCSAMGEDYIITGIDPALASKLTLTHDMVGQSCTSAAACLFCAAAGPAALGHDWRDATCTTPKTCSVCGETDGSALGHAWNERGVCFVCSARTDGYYLETTVDVTGRQQRLRVYDPSTVLPAGTIFEAAYVDGSHGDHNFFIAHTDPTTDVELRHFYNLTLTSGGQTLSQLDGPVEVWFEGIDGIDAADSFISRVSDGPDAKLEPTLYTDADGVTWVKVLTDHFSPYALTDLLSVEEKAFLAPPDNNQSDETQSDETPKHNVQTGDHATQLAVAGLGTALVLALGVMLRLECVHISSRRSRENLI